MCILVNGQANRPSLKLSVGAAAPLGKFGQDEINNSRSGFAKTGVLIDLSYARSLSKRIWVEVMLHGQQNPLNTSALEDGFSNTPFYQGVYVSPVVGPPPPPSSGTTYKNWKFEDDNWLTASLLFGVNGRYPLGASQKLFAQARLMLGPVYVSSPEINGTSSSPTATAHLEQTDANGWGVAYTAGGGVEYDVSNSIYLLGKLDVFGTTSIKFKDIKATLTTFTGPVSNPATVSQTTVTGDAKQAVSTLNVAVGIGFRL